MLRRYKFDIMLIFILISILVIWYAILFFSQNNKEKVVVILYEEQEIMSLDINEDQTILLNKDTPGIDDDSDIDMTIIIKDKYVYVKESNCHNHTCINMGKINKIDDTIACIPNAVVIIIRAKNG